MEGAKLALGIPALGLGLSMFAFGAFLNSSNFSVLHSFISTFFAFALPGQFVMAETLISGGNLLNIFLSVLITNARLFPMTVYLYPIIKNNKVSKWKYYFICHLIAITSWINMINKKKEIKKSQRYYFFLGLGFTLWITSIISTILGYVFSSFISHEFLIILVFFNPLYFLVMILENVKDIKLAMTCLISAFLSPLYFYYFNNWAILLSGLTAGSLIFLYESLQRSD